MTIKKLRNLNQLELKKLENLINKLESEDTHANANTLASEIRKCLADGYISSELKVRIARYCRESNDLNREQTRAIVREISEILFGKILTEYD